MKRMLKNGLALLLCAALVALGLSALFFSCHDCDGETCAVCSAIGEAMRLSREAAVLPGMAATLVLLIGTARKADRLSSARPVSSLVLMKTELLN